MTNQIALHPHDTPAQQLGLAFIGLGAMGEPMCRCLVVASDDLEVTVYDIAAERIAGLVEAGARAAGSPAEASRDAGIVVLAVRDREQLNSSVFGEHGVMSTLRPGATIILTSTVGPDVVRDTARRLAERDIALLDAPVSGGPGRAATGDLLVMVGAPDDVVARCRPVLDRIASTVAHVGQRPGDGQAMKAVNQLLCGVHVAAAAEAVALARGLGLDPQVALDVLGQGAAASFMFADRGPRMIPVDGWTGPVRSRLDIFVKDMGIVTQVARSAHVPTPVASAAEQLYLLGERAGLGARDDSAVVTLLSPPASS
jgi:3-hydroxyisobutyrate dehydrogenase